MKRTLLAILLIALLFGCNKKKKEEEPYVPVKQTYTDIPGTDIYIANADSVFVDTGLVITVKGKGFDPKYKGHYTIKPFAFDTYYSYDNLPEVPEIIYFDESTIKFKYPKNHFRFYQCDSMISDFILVKFSDDPMAELNYQKRYLAASTPKRLYLKGRYTLIKDTVSLTRPRLASSDYFIHYFGGYSCNVGLLIDNKQFISLYPKPNANICSSGKCTIGIPLDSNYNITEGYHHIRLFKNGEELYRDGERDKVYVKYTK